MATADKPQTPPLSRRVAAEGLGAFFLLLAACDDTPGQWSLFVYADARDTRHWQRTDRFKSEGMCRQAGEENVAALPDPAKASFRCVKTGVPLAEAGGAMAV